MPQAGDRFAGEGRAVDKVRRVLRRRADRLSPQARRRRETGLELALGDPTAKSPHLVTDPPRPRPAVVPRRGPSRLDRLLPGDHLAPVGEDARLGGPS
jgi:hypothetical protein